MSTDRPRMRHSCSLSRVSEISETERELQQLAPDKPLHSLADSPFSSASGFSNFRGLLNLGIILLLVANGRAALENLLQYGLLANPLLMLEVFAQSPGQWPCLSLLLAGNLFVACALWLELLAERRLLRGRLLRCLQLGNIALLLALPCCVILRLHPNPRERLSAN